uniref:NADH dehydrogenase subunit 4L n=1 Tax=Pleonexes koreana TaxID=2663336 RepID=A0A5P9W7U8_9CRUS|nr:NADH dehydrogenase subunit 4L [Pleonexes koreana]
MTFFSFFVFFFVIPLCLLKFILNLNHLLISLLILEFISLSFFFGLCSSMHFFNLELVFLLYFLVMVVCEGVLGLCVLVLMSFSYGMDYIFVFNKLLC